MVVKEAVPRYFYFMLQGEFVFLDVSWHHVVAISLSSAGIATTREETQMLFYVLWAVYTRLK